MKTLAFMHLAEISGPARCLYPRLAALADRGELEVLVPRPGPVADLYAQIGTSTVRSYGTLTLPTSSRDFAHAVRELVRDIRAHRRHIRRTRPDVVVVATAMLPAALIAARLEGVPSVVYAVEIFEKPRARGRFRSVARAGLLRLTLRCSNAVVCCSNTVAQQYQGIHGRRRVETIYPGIASISPTHSRDETRQRFNIPPGALCLAVVGSISEGRGQDVAIRSLPYILPLCPDAYCLIVGVPHPRTVDLAYREQLDDIVDQLGVRQHVVFTGFVDPIADLLAAADIVVNPTRINEGFGRVALEALVAGTPVVSTCVGAIPEILVHEQQALLVKPDDPEALALAVLRLWNDPALRKRLVEAGRELVHHRYAEERGVEAFSSVVDTAIADQRKARAHTSSRNRA